MGSHRDPLVAERRKRMVVHVEKHPDATATSTALALGVSYSTIQSDWRLLYGVRKGPKALDTRARILAAVTEDPWSHAQEVANDLGMSGSIVEKHLTDLRREGVVVVQKRRDRRTNRLVTLYAPAECVAESA